MAAIIKIMHAHFPERRAALFESCAARIFETIEPENIVEIDVTQPSRDGGRDAIGKYRIGVEPTYVFSDFALRPNAGHPTRGAELRRPVA